MTLLPPQRNRKKRVLKWNDGNLHFTLCSYDERVKVQHGLHLWLFFTADVYGVVRVNSSNNSLVRVANLEVLRHLGTIKSKTYCNYWFLRRNIIIMIFKDGLSVALESFTDELHVTLNDGSLPWWLVVFFDSAQTWSKKISRHHVIGFPW